MQDKVTIKGSPLLDNDSHLVAGWWVYEVEIYGVKIRVIKSCTFSEASVLTLSDDRRKDADNKALNIEDYKLVAQKLVELEPPPRF